MSTPTYRGQEAPAIPSASGGGGITDSQLRSTPLAITGTVAGPLTDSQLRASAVSVTFTNSSLAVSGSVAITNASLPVTGTFWQATQPVSGTVGISGTVPVSGTFWQATQPVSIASMPSTPVTGTFWQATQPVSGPLTDTQLRASAVPITVGGALPVTPPTLTKGTQGASGLSVQQLKDAGRNSLAMTAEFTFAQVAETLLTMTLSANGGTNTTFTSRTITSGKKFRIQSAILQVELLGSGTAPQRTYLRMRVNTAGATTATSPLQWILPCGVTTAIVKSSNWSSLEIPDGFELNGDGTATFGFTLETPDFVATTATGRAKITIFGIEF